MRVLRLAGALAAPMLLGTLVACDTEVTEKQPRPDSANLTGIAISPGEVDQFFQPNLAEYTSTQPFSVPSVRVTPTAEDEGAGIAVNGAAVASGAQSAPVPLDVGENVIEISVTGADGRDRRDYRLVVTRQMEAAFAQTAYLKASNTGVNDRFGYSIAMSGDTLVVGAPFEASGASGVGGDQEDDGAPEAGAVYVFVEDGGAWTQQSYIKASNAGAGDRFGWSVALDGDTLAVGAWREDSAATGVDGDAPDDAANSGAVYVFTRSDGAWSQQAYIKAPEVTSPPPDHPDFNQPPDDPDFVHPEDFSSGNQFGWSVALSGDVLAVGANLERGAGTGVGADPASVGAPNAGAVYVYRRTGSDWSAPPVYIKPSNTGGGDQFGYAVALDGDTLAVAAPFEDSDATGVGGNGASNAALNSGAVYVFSFDGADWTEQAYIKASNTAAHDAFGMGLALDGDTLAVPAPQSGSVEADTAAAPGDTSAARAGAVYVFTRDGADWAQQAYLRASNAEAGDHFGSGIALEGDVLVVGAVQENGGAGGPGADEGDNSVQDAGAAYVFNRSNDSWSQLSYIKAASPGRFDWFGHAVAVSAGTIAVSALLEDGGGTGLGGDESDDSTQGSGAVYLFR